MANLEEQNEHRPARISWSVGHTSNLGDYEFLRLDMTIEDDQRPGESVKEASERVFKFAHARVLEKVEQTKNELSELRYKAGGY